MESLRARGCVLALQVLTLLLVTMMGAVHGITMAELLPFGSGGLDSLPLPTGDDIERTTNINFMYRGRQIELITVS